MTEDNSKKENDKAKNQEPPSDSRLEAIDRKDEQVSTQTETSYTKNKQQIKWEKASVITSIILAVIAGIGVILVWVQINQTEDALNLARETMYLDQRPWLGYNNFLIQSRKHPDAQWENRGPTNAGEQFRVQFYISNPGKTPALNGHLMSIEAETVRIGGIPPIPEKWERSPEKFVLFPKAEGLNHTGRFALTDQQFSDYKTLQKQIFFWAKVCYSDIIGQHHWTQIGITHTFGDDYKHFSIKSSTINPIPGETPHRDCRN